MPACIIETAIEPFLAFVSRIPKTLGRPKGERKSTGGEVYCDVDLGRSPILAPREAGPAHFVAAVNSPNRTVGRIGGLGRFLRHRWVEVDGRVSSASPRRHSRALPEAEKRRATAAYASTAP